MNMVESFRLALDHLTGRVKLRTEQEARLDQAIKEGEASGKIIVLSRRLDRMLADAARMV